MLRFAMSNALWTVVTLATILGNTGFADEFYTHSFHTKQLDDVFYCEGAGVGDFNRDGKTDIVSGPFWYEGPEFEKRHPYYEPKPWDPLRYSDNFFAFSEDFNADGWTDILIIGFPGKDASWFENPQGQDRFWTRHQVFDVVDNESPTFVDLTGDGRREIVCSTGGYFGFAEPNRDDPTQKWKFRRISDQSAGGKFTHGLGVGDVNGDGRMDLMEKSGWWEQPASLDGDPVWKKHAFQFAGPGGAQMYAYDLDGDGDNDVITSLAAHRYGLAWFENVKGDDGAIAFHKHDIMGDTPEQNRYGVAVAQLHAVDLADIDGDGVKDIVTGKRYWAHGPKGDVDAGALPVVYWFRTVRTGKGSGAEAVDFVPYLIDDDSGVGVEVKARDVNGDGLPDIVVGNKKGTFVSIHSRKKVSREEYLRAQPMPREHAANPLQEGLPKHDGLLPEEAARAMTVPEGFRVQLAAGEPMVHQPIAMAFDARGRLWVAEAHTYPIRAPEDQGKDKIIILEDTDGDGTFDNRKQFIDGLNLVSGLQVGFGGVWVGAAPYLMFIADRDGDDVPDGRGWRVEGGGEEEKSRESRVESREQERKALQFPGDVPGGATVLLDGFGWQDTHETLNSFIWGPDGWLYGCHGVFTHSKVGKPGTPDEQREPLNAGVWRYHPVEHKFEVFARGSSNPWGVDFNDYGQAFITACVIPHLYHVIPGARYQRQGGQHFNPYVYDDIKTIADHAHYAGNIRDHAWWGRNAPAAHNTTSLAGGGHAHCGAMIYLGDNWPDSYRNTLFMSNIHGNRVNNDVLVPHGSGYIGTHGDDFLFANDRWFRGINLKYGPDGGVYVIDWYDKNACHRRTPEIWDRTNGRVFKVSFGETEPVKVDLSKLSDAELVGSQLHSNDWYVRTARRLLQERSAAGKLADGTHAALRDILENHADVTRKLRALWALHATGGFDDGQLATLLNHQDEHLRASAVRLLLEDRSLSDKTAEKFTSLSRDEPSPVVRLELAAALQRMPVGQRWPICEGLLSHAEDADDHNLPLMIWYATEPLVVEDAPRALTLAARSQIPAVSRFIIRRAATDENAREHVLEQLAHTADPAVQQLVLDEITNVVQSRGRLKMPQAWPDIYAKLSKSESARIREQVQFITVKFGDKSIFPALRAIVADGKSNADSREQALAALLAGKDAELPPLLHKMLDDPAVRRSALRGLARFDDAETPTEILSRYKSFDKAARDDAVTTLASRPSYALALLDAIGNGDVPRDDLSAFTVGQMRRFEDEEITARLNKVWGAIRATSAEKQQLIAQFKRQLAPAALADADLPRGRALYKETCAKCHKLFGDGGQIGPDITGSNRANLDYVLENLLDPSAVVGRDYQMTVVATNDGRVISGLIKEENESALSVQTTNEVIVVPKEDIDQRAKSTASMMPEDQLAKLKPHEVRNLIAYLANPSQVPLPGEGPLLDPKTGRVARAIEGEAMKVLAKTAGDARSQKMDRFPKDKWSGADHLWWTGAKPGDKLTLELPVKDPGRYEVLVVMTKARDYGAVQLTIDDGKPIGPFDLFNSPDVITTGVVSLGTHELSAGEHRLTIEITGANAKAEKAYMFGLDYVYFGVR